MGLLAEKLLRLLLDAGHARLSADENDLIDRRKTGIAHAAAARAARTLDEIVGELLELRLRERHLEMLRTRCIRRDERQGDVERRSGGKSALGVFGRLFQTLTRHHVRRDVNALLGLERIDHPLHDRLVEIVAAQVRIAVGGLDLEHAVADVEHGDIERAAAEVVDRDLLVLLLVETVGKRCRSRLVDDAEHLETRNRAGILRRLTLRVVEVRGHRDDGLRDLLAKIGLGVAFQLRENLRGNLLSGVLAALDLDGRIAVLGGTDLIRHHLDLFGHLIVATPHETLDGVDRGLRVRDSLTLRRLTDELLARLRKRNDRRRGTRTFSVGYDHRLAALHDSHTAVGRSQVNS